MANEIRRTSDLRLRLDPALMARLEVMATDYGMPPATFAAFAVADFLNKQDQSKSAMRMAVMEAGRKASEFSLSEDQMQRVFGPMMAQLVKEMTPGAVIDQEAPRGAQ